MESGYNWKDPRRTDSGWRLETPEEIEAFLAHSHIFEGMDEGFLRWLADQAFVKFAAPGEALFSEARIAEYLYLVIDARIGFSYGAADDAHRVFLRTIDGVGELLGWSALVDPRRYRRADGSLNLDPAVARTYIAQPLDPLCYSKKMLITSQVTTHFFDTQSESISYTLHARPTAESR